MMVSYGTPIPEPRGGDKSGAVGVELWEWSYGSGAMGVELWYPLDVSPVCTLRLAARVRGEAYFGQPTR